MTGAGGIVQQLAAFELEGEPLQLPEDVLATADVEGTEMVGVPVDGTYPGFPPPVTGPDTVRPPAGGWSSPSFDCRNARTRSEAMICGLEKLARRDRRTVEALHSALAGA